VISLRSLLRVPLQFAAAVAICCGFWLLQIDAAGGISTPQRSRSVQPETAPKRDKPYQQAIPISASPTQMDGIGNFTVYVTSDMMDGKKVWVGLDASGAAAYDSPATNHGWPFELNYGATATGRLTLPIHLVRKLGQQTPPNVTIYVYKYDVSPTPGNETVHATAASPADGGNN
jgi:hypothetical protein